MRCPLCTSLQPRAASAFTQSNAFRFGEQPLITPSLRGSTPPPNAWFLGPTGVHNPNGISIDQLSRFVRLTIMTNRQIHLYSNRQRLRTVCMRCRLKSDYIALGSFSMLLAHTSK